jgi:hypothetical protein
MWFRFSMSDMAIYHQLNNHTIRQLSDLPVISRLSQPE